MYSIKIIALFIFAEYGRCRSDGQISSDEENNGRECNICLSKIINEDELQTLPCRHVFHEECIIPWLALDHNTCPTCRAEIPRHVGSIVIIANSLVKMQQMQTETLGHAQHYRYMELENAQRMLNKALVNAWSIAMKASQKSKAITQKSPNDSEALETAQNIQNEKWLRLIEANGFLEKAVQDAKCAIDEATKRAQRFHNEAKAHIKQGMASLLSAQSAALGPNERLVAALKNSKHLIAETMGNAQNFLNETMANSKRIENEARERADFIDSEAKANGLSTPAEALPNARGLLDYAKETAERIQSETTATAARIRNETMEIAERIRTEALANAQRIKDEFENALRMADEP